MGIISYNHLKIHYIGEKIVKCRPIEDLRHLIDKKALEHTLAAINDPPEPGEVEGNCHNISIALMSDLMFSRLSEGYKLITTKKYAVGGGDHSWLECDGWSIYASTMLRKPDCPVPEDEYHIYVGNAFDYRKRLGVKRFYIKRQFTDKEMVEWYVALY